MYTGVVMPLICNDYMVVDFNISVFKLLAERTTMWTWGAITHFIVKMAQAGNH